jgi:Undecaprenyl-phosphate glucose phosphotransferase
VAQVQQLRGEPVELDHDRRVSADDAVARGPVDLGGSVIASDYPPAAVTALFAIEAAAVFGLGGAIAGMHGIGAGEGAFGPHHIIFIAAAMLFPVLATVEGYAVARPRTVTSLWGLRLIGPLALAILGAVGLFVAIRPAAGLAPSVSALAHWFAIWFVACYAVAGGLGSGFELLFRHRARRGKAVRHVVVFGGGLHGQRFIEALARRNDPLLKVDAFFDERTKSIPAAIADIPFGGGADELITHVQYHGIDEIFVALPWAADRRILDILRKFRPLPASVRLAPESALLHPGLATWETAAAALAPIIRHTPLSPWGQFFKSILDRLVAAVALLWLSPLFAALAIAIKLTSPGPVFFKQNRLGFNNLPFPVYKFRTMRVARSDEETLKQATRKDSRITPIGAFLRRWSLDELPQLINVMRGNMSLVGPRPHPMWKKAGDLWEEGGSEPLEAIIHEYAARHRVMPGITGWAQVSGYRGETSTVERMLKRVELDIYYIDHWSLWFDIRIILTTFTALFRSEGAY